MLNKVYEWPRVKGIEQQRDGVSFSTIEVRVPRYDYIVISLGESELKIDIGARHSREQ